MSAIHDLRVKDHKIIWMVIDKTHWEQLSDAAPVGLPQTASLVEPSRPYEGIFVGGW
jgi:hypothetical protein